jgi:hypothetical protein
LNVSTKAKAHTEVKEDARVRLPAASLCQAGGHDNKNGNEEECSGVVGEKSVAAVGLPRCFYRHDFFEQLEQLYKEISNKINFME